METTSFWVTSQDKACSKEVLARPAHAHNIPVRVPVLHSVCNTVISVLQTEQADSSLHDLTSMVRAQLGPRPSASLPRPGCRGIRCCGRARCGTRGIRLSAPPAEERAQDLAALRLQHAPPHLQAQSSIIIMAPHQYHSTAAP